ncbi:MAG TPA: lysine--tRNA ligase, partial [Deltaproteobacteria bacterium]|nr:lysine--tRNA ligase [Deltaproteobacteria bacterium]
MVSGKAGSVIEDRKAKAERLKAEGINLYPAGYSVDITSSEAVDRFQGMDEQSLERESGTYSMAGRVMSRRDFGKASFIHIKDRTGRVQVYVRKDRVPPDKFGMFKLMDIGDFIGVRGPFFRTRTGELTLLAEDISLLSKSMRPLPEKWHGLTDVETRYRQ